MLWTILIGIVIGWLASLLVKGEGLGLIGDLVVGVLGAWLGRFMSGYIGIRATNTTGFFIISIIGAVVLLVVIRAIFGGKSRS